MKASQRGYIAVVQLLLDAGADKEAIDSVSDKYIHMNEGFKFKESFYPVYLCQLSFFLFSFISVLALDLS